MRQDPCRNQTGRVASGRQKNAFAICRLPPSVDPLPTPIATHIGANKTNKWKTEAIFQRKIVPKRLHSLVNVNCILNGLCYFEFLWKLASKEIHQTRAPRLAARMHDVPASSALHGNPVPKGTVQGTSRLRKWSPKIGRQCQILFRAGQSF